MVSYIRSVRIRHSSFLVWRFKPLSLSRLLMLIQGGSSIRADELPVWAGLHLNSFFPLVARSEMHHVFITSPQTGDDDDETNTAESCSIDPLPAVTLNGRDPLLSTLPSHGYRIYNERPSSFEVREYYLSMLALLISQRRRTKPRMD